MVSVFFGYDKSAVVDIDGYFELLMEDEWFSDQFVIDMVKGIDNTIVESPHCFMSPVLGQIAPSYLSGGLKVCILLYCLPIEDMPMFDLGYCGENCEVWLSKIFSKRDIRVSMNSNDLTFEGLEMKGICENDGSTISDWKDWVRAMVKFASEDERDEG